MIGGPTGSFGGPRPAEGTALDRFTRWLTSLGDALETADGEALKPLFTVEATYAPDPFAPLERGRRAAVERLIGEIAGDSGLSFEARILGAGETYGVAHVRLVSEERHVDGIVLAALDGRGRCTALRRWAHEVAPDAEDGAAEPILDG